MQKWAVQRLMIVEGGFQGRTNKLVDGCYSFWMGATLEILSLEMSKNKGCHSETQFEQAALLDFILNCCQAECGGLRDKPSK
jgi:protein farnesyltransferase subunit beta